MILLDTNVVSALMRNEPDPRVVAWLDRQPPESVWTTSITLFEIFFGLELLARGRRRRRLLAAFERTVVEDLEGRIVAFDRAAAEASGKLGARRQRAGESVEIRDLQIAGIAVARRARLATANTKHFRGLGLDLVDPSSSAGKPR